MELRIVGSEGGKLAVLMGKKYFSVFEKKKETKTLTV
jgi:hypothetical protein